VIHLIIFFSSLLSQCISNPSSAIIMYYTLKNLQILSMKDIIICILLGTNCCFSLHFNYPTHILANRNFKYDFLTFFKFGIFLDILFGFTSANIIYFYTTLKKN
jgi:di/tricarboxylate transporter